MTTHQDEAVRGPGRLHWGHERQGTEHTYEGLQVARPPLRSCSAICVSSRLQKLTHVPSREHTSRPRTQLHSCWPPAESSWHSWPLAQSARELRSGWRAQRESRQVFRLWARGVDIGHAILGRDHNGKAAGEPVFASIGCSRDQAPSPARPGRQRRHRSRQRCGGATSDTLGCAQVQRALQAGGGGGGRGHGEGRAAAGACRGTRHTRCEAGHSGRARRPFLRSCSRQHAAAKGRGLTVEALRRRPQPHRTLGRTCRAALGQGRAQGARARCGVAGGAGGQQRGGGVAAGLGRHVGQRRAGRQEAADLGGQWQRSVGVGGGG